MDEKTAESITDALKLIVEKINPEARYLSKYGGEVIAPDPDSDDFVGGIFIYKDHVTLEFSNGASFNDKEGYLEGKGKNRRNLKFSEEQEVAKKNAEYFLRQALEK